MKEIDFYRYFMTLPRSNKSLETSIKKEVARISCPLHHKQATVSMPDENKEVEIEACCSFFTRDVKIVAERMRKDFLYKAEKTRERLDREWKKGKRDGL